MTGTPTELEEARAAVRAAAEASDIARSRLNMAGMVDSRAEGASGNYAIAQAEVDAAFNRLMAAQRAYMKLL